MLLAAAPARAQPRRPQRAVTAAVVAERARAMLADGRAADALAAIAAAPARQRTAPEVVAVRAIATFQTLGVRPEPSSLRSLSPSVRRDLEGVLRVLTPWVAAHEGDGPAALALGRAQLVRGDMEAAARSLDAATEALPQDPVAWNDEAMVLVALRRLPEAERCLGEATRLAPRDAEPWSNLGAVRLARGAADRAAEAFRRAIEVSPTEPRHHSDLGSALLAGGDLAGATASYQRAAALDPDNGVVLANLGYALAHGNRLDEALAVLQRAVERAPRSVTAWNNLAMVSLRRGDREGARSALERARAIDPADPRTRASLEALGADAGVRSVTR